MRARGALGIVICLTAGLVSAAGVSSKEEHRIADAAAVLGELHATPDTDVPQDLWNKSRCVIVIPSLKKAALVFGGEYGAGLMSCRQDGGWSAPVFMQIGKGSWGLQAGAESIDLVMLVMNERGMQKMLQDKVSLGVDASLAAGPVGREARAATDAQMHAEILSYSRTQGLFAGIDLSGGVLRPDSEDNRDLYGHDIRPREVLSNKAIKAPPATEPFMKALRVHDGHLSN